MTHTPIRDVGGQIVTEEQTIQVPRYKTVTIFDYAQTEGPPLPELAAELTGDVQQYDAFMEAVRQTAPVPIWFKSLPPDLDGFYSLKDRNITLREGMSQIQTVCAAVHECTYPNHFLNHEISLEALVPAD